MKTMLSLWEDDTQEVKESLRREMRRMRAQLPDHERAHASRAASEHLLGLPELSGGVIAVYAAMRGEASPAHAAAALERRGATLVYPRVQPGERVLRFHRVADATALVLGGFGVPEPAADQPEVPLERIDVIVVPGLAFDERGHRLGWGKGHYDSTLARARALRVGFAYLCQIISEVPVDAHDASMDLLVTETGARRISARASAPPTNPRVPS